MIIYPAIDLRQGRCVRLRQGDPAAETVFSEDPVAMARTWAEQGAEWLHIVNLDGALSATQMQIDLLHRSPTVRIQHPGESAPTSAQEELNRRLPVNLRCLRDIRSAVTTSIQFGGGLRTLDDIRLAVELGANRIVLGTAAIENPQLVSDALALWGSDRIVVGVDARDGKVATHGWKQVSSVDVIDLGHRMQALGVRRVLYTDIARDGMLSGVNLSMTSQLGDVTGLSVIASGGVSDISDIERLKEFEHYNIDGVVVGQALYTGRLALADAIRIGNRPLVRRSAGVVPVRRTPAGVEFLLIYNHFFEQWQFPRGGVRSGESDLAAARRELDEETGLPIVTLYESCRSELHYISVIRGYDIQRTIVYYLAEVGDGEVVLGHMNHCEARWGDPRTTWELLTETSPEQLPAFDAAMEFLGIAQF
jgi:phosphoribosylformimino-5-aminoimidazole carboxamide ribotide isomerase